MYSITIGNNVLYRYKLQWHGYNGKRYYVKQTKILHATSLQAIKDKAKQLFGNKPDYIQRI